MCSIMQEVRDEGRSDHAIEVAKRCLAKGMAPSLAAEIAGLPLSQVLELAGQKAG